MRVVNFSAEAGAVLHVWLKAAPGVQACRLDVAQAGSVWTVSGSPEEDFTFQTLSLPHGGPGTLSWDDKRTQVSLAYTYDPDEVLSRGIAVLVTNPENEPPDVNGIHFRPPFGWMNDPNGLCRVGDRYHLFYQHYPHAQRWSSMHWGHAVSRDLVRWTHLPVFLFPSEAVRAAASGQGGAFSGSALPRKNGGLRVYYTEHLPTRVPHIQVQFSAVSDDTVHAGPSTMVLSDPPEGAGAHGHFRDPYVFRGPDQRLKMLVGSSDGEAGVVLLFETTDPEGERGWTFVGRVHRDARNGTTVAECPCMVPLGTGGGAGTDLWALAYAADRSTEPETGRPNLAYVVVGTFDGHVFLPAFEREFDFVGDAYAFQAFADGDRAVGLAWLANWNAVDRARPFPTAMTLPRHLSLVDGALVTAPLPALAALRRDLSILAAGALRDGVGLPPGPVELELTFARAGQPFRLEFGHPEIGLALVQDKDGLELAYRVNGKPAGPRYRAKDAAAAEFRIFLDAGSVEVFADKGRWVGTKRLDSLQPVERVRLVSPESGPVGCRLWKLDGWRG